MEADTFRVILASTAAVCTVLQFLSGIISCKKIARKRTTGDMSSFTFISGHLSTTLWLRYGFLINDYSLIFVNSLGTVLFFSYIVVFYYYSIKQISVLRQFCVSCAILIIVLIYSVLDGNVQKVTTNVGLVCCSITIVFFAAPLTSIANVIKTKNTDSLPFPMIVMGFVVSCQWYIYGVLLQDKFIQIPNFLGTVLTMLQLSLFCIYPTKIVDIESI